MWATARRGWGVLALALVAMAAADDVLVVPHGSSVYAYHLQYAFPNCPVAEFGKAYCRWYA